MQDFEMTLQHLKSETLAILPNILIALLVLVAGFFLGKLAKYIVVRLFIFFQGRMGESFKALDFKKPGVLLGSICFWLVMFASALIVANILQMEIFTTWIQGLLQYAPNILAAILIVLAASMIGTFISNSAELITQKTGVQISPSLVTIIRILLLLVAIIIALDQIGVEISLLIDIIDIILAAILFGAALAFGLGARTSINNILASYYVRKRYKVGDEIQIGKERGEIIKIEATHVILDNEIGQLTVPAKEFQETKSYLIKSN